MPTAIKTLLGSEGIKESGNRSFFMPSYDGSMGIHFKCGVVIERELE